MRTITLALAGIGATLLAGCGIVPVQPDPNLPPVVRQVVDNKNAFAAQRNPLANASVGEVRDALALETLDGCWGVYQPSDVAATSEPLDVLYSVLTFDAATATVTDYEYEVTSPRIVNVLSRTIGTFTITDANHMVWQTLSRLASDPASGELVVDSNGVTFDPTNVMATLDGDALKIWLPDANGNYGEDDVFIMKKMSCQ